MKKLLLPLLILIPLMVPSVNADTITEETYNIAATVQSRDNPTTGQILSHIITVDPYVFDGITTSFAVLEVTHHAFITNVNTGIYTFTVTWDGTNLACMWDIETLNTGITVSSQFPFNNVFCRLTNAQLSAGIHTLAFSRATTAGTPSTILHETLSYKIDRTDIVGILTYTTELTNIQNTLDTGFTNLTDYLDHINQHLHEIDSNIDVTRGEILDVLSNLNVTLTGNLTIDNSTMQAIYDTLTIHREKSLEVFDMENILLLILLLLIIIAEWKKDAIYHLLAALLGVLSIVQEGEMIIPRLVLVALIAYQTWRFIAVISNARDSITPTTS